MRDHLPNKSRFTHPEWESLLEWGRDYIKSALIEYPNFKDISYSDVSAGGISVKGFHKQVSGYCYPNYQSTILYDFSNFQEALDEFVAAWIEYDTPEYIEKYNDMLRTFEKWGTE